MYLNYYGFKKEPFQITPDPSFLFLSPGHKEALASIIYGVEKRKGFILIIGPVGVGKTTILRAYLEKVDNKTLKTIYIFNSNITYLSLLKQILLNLNMIPESEETTDILNQLHHALVEEYRAGRNVLLLIDEAQNMPVDTLENLRMLSNLETTTDKLIQVVFSGQTEFDITLNLQELKQLKQRIAVKAVISPLTENEAISYVTHRLKAVSEKEKDVFSSKALRKIVKYAKGIPRVINVLCDNCLITAYGHGKKQISVGVVNEILQDFGVKTQHSRILLKATLFVLLSAGIYFFSFCLNQSKDNRGEVLKVSDNKASGVGSSRIKKLSSSPTGPTAAFNVKYIHKVVEKGDTLAKLIMEVYGHVDERMIKLVKRANPHISDENVIIEGGRITFPIKNDTER